MDIIAEVKKERDKVQRQLAGFNAALVAFAGVYGKKTRASRPHRISAAGRARIAAAARARWARVKGQQKVVPISKAGKRTMSAAARRKIAASQRARWAKIRVGKK